jgi:hypothetical protein
MSHLIENPFAVAAKRPSSRLWPALKGLAMIGGLFAILVVAQAQSRRWLLDRWVSGISDLPVAEQVQRLLQIDALGDIATETVARRLAAKDDAVASTAYELLREHLGEWSIRDDQSLGRAHKNMIAGLEAVAPELTGDRARWAKELLNQSIVECAERKIRDMDEAFVAANRVLAILSPPPAINLQSAQSLASTAASPVLPDAIYQGIERPRLLPLTVEPTLQVDSLATAQVEPVDEPSDSLQNAAPEPLTAIVPAPRVMPVAAELTPTNESMTISAAKASAEAQEVIQPVRHLTQSAYETFDTKSVITLLGSNQADVRDQAVNELVKRGLSNEEIRVANQLASPVVDVRLGLLESIVNRTDLDPRPWLLWLAEDPQREVRMRAVTTLATMNDASIRQALQQRLTQEHDPTVIAHLKRVINTR